MGSGVSKSENWYKKSGTTKLAAIRVSHIDDSLEVINSNSTHCSGSETTLLMEKFRLS